MSRKKYVLTALAMLLCGGSVSLQQEVGQEQVKQEEQTKDLTKEVPQAFEQACEMLLNFVTSPNFITDTCLGRIAQELGMDLETVRLQMITHSERLLNAQEMDKEFVSILMSEKTKEMEQPEVLGTNWSMEECQEYMNTEDGRLQLQICREYGMDPYLLFALEKTESGLNHEDFVGTKDPFGNTLYAIGITQQEKTNFYTKTASKEEKKSKPDRKGYNYVTKQTDAIPRLVDLLSDFEINSRLGVMELTNALKSSDLTVDYALDIYNKGKVGADRFRDHGIVSGNPNYVNDVYENLVVPYLIFQTSDDQLTTVAVANSEKHQVTKLSSTEQDAIRATLQTIQELLNQSIQNDLEEGISRKQFILK